MTCQELLGGDEIQISITTDYAIRMMVYLSANQTITPASEISEQMKIPQSYVLKVSRVLRDAGFIVAFCGINGGYRTTKSPEQISLYDIISTMERTVKINYCLEEGAPCNRHAAETCPVRPFYVHLQMLMEEQMRGTTIADIIK